VQLGSPGDAPRTRFVMSSVAPGLPWRSIWQLWQSDFDEPGSLRFVPDLCTHIVFDLSGLIDVEPFVVQTGLAPVDLELPPGAWLLGLQLPVWDGIMLRDEHEARDDGADSEARPAYAVRFDVQWVHWLYFLLLEASNENRDVVAALAAMVVRFASGEDENARYRDLRRHFYKVMNAASPEARLAYSDRQQRRLYRELTDLSPAQFERVLRFQRSLRALMETGVAGMEGYFDQAHQIKEYCQLCGMTPGDVARRFARHTRTR
jgi:AraC-like DNA-binding protein